MTRPDSTEIHYAFTPEDDPEAWLCKPEPASVRAARMQGVNDLAERMGRPTFDEAIHRAPIRDDGNSGVFVFWAIFLTALTALAFLVSLAAWWVL